MIFDKDNDIIKISNKRLDWLVKNQNKLAEVPEDIDKKIMNRLKENSKTIEIEKSNKYSFINNSKIYVIAAGILFIFFTGIIFYLFNSNTTYFNNNKITLLNINGQVFLNGKAVKENLNNKLFINNKTLSVNENSSLDLRIGDNSIVKINQNSIVQIKKIRKNKLDEYSVIYLRSGSINCSVTLPSVNSGFEVATDNCLFKVKGTQFDVAVDENKNAILRVAKGVVELSNYISKDIKLNKTDKNEKYYEDLITLIDSIKKVKEDESITLKNKEIKNYNKELFIFFKKINKKPYAAADITQEIAVLKKRKSDLFQYSENVNENLLNNIIIKKLNIKLGIQLNEYDTVITSDKEKYLYISSNTNKAVYCIDLLNDKLKWKFIDKRIQNIESPAIPFKDKIVLSTPNMIYIIDQSGKLIDFKNIEKGPSYWSYPEIYSGRLFIPAFNTIYTFDGQNIQILDNSIPANGQIYINCLDNNIYFTLLNEKKVKKYSLIENRITWESGIFSERSFMPALVTVENLFIADIQGNVYKYNLNGNLNNRVKISSGIISNLISDNRYLFFIAENGYFYKLQIDKFDAPEKLTAVDNNPVEDKYLVKKMFLKDNYIYYNSDNGKLFVYNLKNGKGEFINIPENSNNSPLVGTPVKIGENLFFLDTESNIYKISN